jgi:hypothetical protein
VDDEVGAEVSPVAEVVVPPLVAMKIVSVSQDNNDSDDESNDSDGVGNASDDLGSSSDDDEHDGSDNDDSEDKALHIPFRMTPAGIMSFKCRICLGEEYDSEAKVVLHAIDVIKQDAGSLDVVERHCQVLWARRRR